MVRSIKLKMFAALLLRAMAQEQAETGAGRVSPPHPNVAHRLGLQPGSPESEIAERYLVGDGYIRPSAVDRDEGDPFTITETGREDLGYQRSVEGWRRRPWWRRMIGVQGNHGRPSSRAAGEQPARLTPDDAAVCYASDARLDERPSGRHPPTFAPG